MKESQIAVVEEFVDNVKILINALGDKVLEPFVQVDSSSATVDDELLYITSGSVNATGKVTAEGFVVFARATVNEKTSVKSLSAGMQKQRQKLFDSLRLIIWLQQRIFCFLVHQQLQISFWDIVLVDQGHGKLKMVEL